MYTIDMESIAFWINPAILVGIGTLLWRSQVRRFDRIDKRFDRIDRRFDRVDAEFGDLTREVVANGKSFARIEGRHEGHPGPPKGPPEPRRLTPL